MAKFGVSAHRLRRSYYAFLVVYAGPGFLIIPVAASETFSLAVLGVAAAAGVVAGSLFWFLEKDFNEANELVLGARSLAIWSFVVLALPFIFIFWEGLHLMVAGVLASAVISVVMPGLIEILRRKETYRCNELD